MTEDAEMITILTCESFFFSFIFIFLNNQQSAIWLFCHADRQNLRQGSKKGAGIICIDPAGDAQISGIGSK